MRVVEWITPHGRERVMVLEVGEEPNVRRFRLTELDPNGWPMPVQLSNTEPPWERPDEVGNADGDQG